MVDEGKPEDRRHDSPPLESELLKHYREISDFARSEVSGVRSVYKWLLTLITSAVTVLFVIGIYFTYKSQTDLKRETREEIDRQTQVLEGRLTSMESEGRDRLNKQVAELRQILESRVEQEFKAENIRALVEDKARTRIEQIADPLIRKHITQSIEPKVKEVEERLKAVDTDLKEAKSTLAGLKTISEYTTTVLAAQNDDRQAFDRLKVWADDPSFRLRGEAINAWNKILNDHASLIVQSGYGVSWKEGIDPAQISLSELKAHFASTPPHVRLGLLEYIWNRKDFSKRERMQFLVDVLKTDNSLRVVEHAARLFLSESKQKLKPLAVDQLIKWWDSNKDKIGGN